MHDPFQVNANSMNALFGLLHDQVDNVITPKVLFEMDIEFITLFVKTYSQVRSQVKEHCNEL